MSPAGSAVLRNVLVEDVGQIVSSIDVIPDPLFWEVDRCQVPGDETSWHLNLGHHVRRRSDRARSILANSSQQFLLSGGNGSNEGSADKVSHK